VNEISLAMQLVINCFVAEVVKPIAALLSDIDQGPFRLLIIDSIIGMLPCQVSNTY
jgi:hypothetical protein